MKAALGKVTLISGIDLAQPHRGHLEILDPACGSGDMSKVREARSEKNSLPAILTQWFGPDAGRPGTNNPVVFERMEEGYRMRPAGARLVVSAVPGIRHT